MKKVMKQEQWGHRRRAAHAIQDVVTAPVIATRALKAKLSKAQTQPTVAQLNPLMIGALGHPNRLAPPDPKALDRPEVLGRLMTPSGVPVVANLNMAANLPITPIDLLPH